MDTGRKTPYVERVAIGRVKPNPDNPRVIRDEKFQKLVASIREFPAMLALRPIVVNADNVVLGGNMRLRACEAAGLKEVPIVRADALTPEEQRRFIIADNVGFGDWDWDTLANEWDAGDLEAWGVDVPWKAEEMGMPAIETPSEKLLEQMTFTVTNEQADIIREAIDAAKAAGPFVDTGNANSNGNGLARVAELALGAIR